MLNQDTELPEGTLERLLAVLPDHPEVAVVFGPCRWGRSSGISWWPVLGTVGSVLDVGGDQQLLSRLLPETQVTVANTAAPADVLLEDSTLPFESGAFDAAAARRFRELGEAHSRPLRYAWRRSLDRPDLSLLSEPRPETNRVFLAVELDPR